MTVQRTSYFKNLDSFRAIAAFSVFFYHASLFVPKSSTPFYLKLNQYLSFNGYGGYFGVVFFFILSGFLITYLMFEEKEGTKSFSVKNFYMRRILRIWPLYYFILAIGYIVYPTIRHYFGYIVVDHTSPLMMIFFAANFQALYNHLPKLFIFHVQWSIAIEEQFYVIWPLIFKFAKDKRLFLLLVGILTLGSESFFHFAPNLEVGYFHFFGSLRFLAYGAMLAYVSFYHPLKLTTCLNRLNKWIIFVIYAVCLLALFYRDSLKLNFPSYVRIDHYLPIAFFLFIIAEQNFCANSFFKFGRIKALSWLGRISYGIYMYHMVTIRLALDLFPPNGKYFFIRFGLCIGFTILLSYLSYTYLEKYFLKLKKNYS